MKSLPSALHRDERTLGGRVAPVRRAAVSLLGVQAKRMLPTAMKLFVALCVTALVGCRSANPNLAGDIAGGMLAGIGAAVSSRGAGGCYADCGEGYFCDGYTGNCEPLPCHGECASNEQCLGEGSGARCERVAVDPDSAPRVPRR
jgi:hypothetical protein